MTDSVVMELIKNCPKIKSIYLKSNRICVNLKDSEISELRTQTDGQNNGIKLIEYKSDSNSDSDSD